MESNGVGMFSNMTSSGMLGLEMSLHHPQHHIPQQNPNHPHPHHQHMMAFGNTEAERRQQPPQQSVKQAQPVYPFASKPKPLTISDEDEPNPPTEDSGDGKRKVSPWQRMKWTDSMVRLLIMVVFYIGDEVGSDQGGPDPGGKKKGAGVLQKKGKWKSVSRAMMERGFFVSPQQCEDKFNDLNKRYKRVNDILGKGTACRVVENQSLLDTMDHISLKMKEEVKKLLNSKHLFFREMCAYHNSCGSGGIAGGGGGVHQSPPEVQPEPSQHQQQRCLHSDDKNAPALSRAQTERSRMEHEDDDDDDDGEDDNDDDIDDDDDDNDDDEVEMVHRENGHNEDEGVVGRNLKKKQRRVEMTMVQPFNNELMSVVQDVTKSLWEKRQWMKTRLMQLEEQRMGYQRQAFELEKQRLKWLKFSWKKEREMEGEKLKNERMKLENDRMVLLLRQKELELLDLQQHSSNKRGDPSSITG